MKLLTTSMDASYISELANYLQSHEIGVHVSNQGASSLPGSGSYQRSIFVLSEDQYEDAISLLKDGGYWGESEKNGSSNEKSFLNNKWVVFVAAIILAFLLALAIF